MQLTVRQIASMLDLSFVRTNCDEAGVRELVELARQYEVGQVSILQCYIPLVKKLLGPSSSVRVVGNVSFPSGSDSTSIKVAQTREMVEAGCDEIDVVINVGYLLSGDDDRAEADVRAVIEAAGGLPVKVILETPYLNADQVRRGCEISIRAGAAFVKTGTGWAPRSTTMEDIALIRSIVGDRIRVKASGGIRSLETLAEMYKLGVTRFGINKNSGKALLDRCIAQGGKIDF